MSRIFFFFDCISMKPSHILHARRWIFIDFAWCENIVLRYYESVEHASIKLKWISLRNIHKLRHTFTRMFKLDARLPNLPSPSPLLQRIYRIQPSKLSTAPKTLRELSQEPLSSPPSPPRHPFSPPPTPPNEYISHGNSLRSPSIPNYLGVIPFCAQKLNLIAPTQPPPQSFIWAMPS